MQHTLKLLNKEAIQQKITRLAYQIVEQNSTATHLTLAGIAPIGYTIAAQLAVLLPTIKPIPIQLLKLELNKKNPTTITTTPTLDMHMHTVILIDDVSMTGRTMLYAMQALLPQHPTKIQTLVLVERQHKNFPIHSDHVGLHVSTTPEQLIIVEQIGTELVGAYLQ